MLLMSDGTVICRNSSGGTDGVGKGWDRLTPDIHGSYMNGTWDTIASMNETRIYFSSQILKDGRVYVAGGEYGDGSMLPGGEVFDPITSTWTIVASGLTSTDQFSDGNSEMLPDGTVLQGNNTGAGELNNIFDPVAGVYSPAAGSGSHSESTWVKLKDSSILFVDFLTYTQSMRFIPASGTWVIDAITPFPMYSSDPINPECGPAFLLPDGRAAFFSGDRGLAYYTPSGTTSPGVWSIGPSYPSGLTSEDAPGSMMANGKILCALGPAAFTAPTHFYEFDYISGSFLPVAAPGGGATIANSTNTMNMLNLPDGTILFSQEDSAQYYVYTMSGIPLAAGKPVIDSVIMLSCSNYMVTGKLFNGISEGSCYGDDAQMATNYPIIRLSTGGNVYYTRTYDWNRTGVQTGSLPDTTYFEIPTGLPNGSYQLEVTANGNPSNRVTFITCGALDANGFTPKHSFEVSPNPATDWLLVQFDEASQFAGYTIVNTFGQLVQQGPLNNKQISLTKLGLGTYYLKLTGQNGTTVCRFVKM